MVKTNTLERVLALQFVKKLWNAMEEKYGSNLKWEKVQLFILQLQKNKIWTDIIFKQD